MSDDKSPGSGFALSQSVSHLLHRAQQLAADWFAKNAADDGVTLRQFAVLAAISEKPGQNQTDLVRATGVDRSTLADMIARMEKRGWVSRKTATNDARAKAVSLSAAGKKILNATLPIARGADEAVLTSIAVTKRDAFLKTLEQLAAAVDAAADTPAPKAAPAAPAPAKPSKAAKPAKPVKAEKTLKPAAKPIAKPKKPIKGKPKKGGKS